MCGRFSLGVSPEDLWDFFGLDQAPDSVPRYNVAPSTSAIAIREIAGVRRADPLRWGLIPHWAKDARVGYSTINARAETVAIKPAFRDAFRRRRCLIPADGFYEWQPRPGSKVKQPYFISRTDGAPLAMAGLWERWRGPVGEVVESCAVIVTAANRLLRPIHDRMPVLLDPEHFAAWLDPANDDTQALLALLRPYSSEPLRVVPVSRRVNDPRHDDAALRVPLEAPESA
ncbi:SOS response-associated peptidase [Thiococcus pfennigii]|jgi:putative SOS response-associated peptidase YedK|uniref:SOS response-associated peptidase n=1 Tax=Thiococcus pfennigii TaxID=1057 RepID=UPI001907555A|nr:SOS response-associated peptidase [Thiococcus pfennigii]MBK1701872.1 hypothetical protein [Thiococcus pfennigii]MBK1730947.1 hypothetical protein [Thiococcus pfennigii]